MLESWACSAYSTGMDSYTDQNPPGWLVESLERSEAQVAAGEIVALAPVLDRLRASIARMKVLQAQEMVEAARKA